MEKVFHFESPEEVYRADACVISCIDARFDLAVRKFLKRRGIVVYDHVKVPGSAKPLATGNAAERDFLLGMVRTSMRLHHAGRVLLIGHNGCGGYPGAPPDAIVADLARAAGVLLAAEPGLTVECYFADFDGIYAIEAAAAGSRPMASRMP